MQAIKRENAANEKPSVETARLDSSGVGASSNPIILEEVDAADQLSSGEFIYLIHRCGSDEKAQ